jgi:hypothetical protein
MINNMTERLDEAKKYIELFKASASRSKEADIYWSKALDIFKVVDATVKKEEVRELESLENEMISAFYDTIERSEFKRRNHYSY